MGYVVKYPSSRCITLWRDGISDRYFHYAAWTSKYFHRTTLFFRKCEDSPLHDPECRILRVSYLGRHLHDAWWCWRWGILQSTGVKVQIDSFGSINMMYACISVLRALALKSGPSQVWRDYTKFDSHLEERMKTEIYTKVQKLKNSDIPMNMKM